MGILMFALAVFLIAAVSPRVACVFVLAVCGAFAAIACAALVAEVVAGGSG
jgi:hypothetical protein